MAASRRILRIDLALPEPAYRQIANGLRAALVAGAFRPGDRLPTIRQLAVDLGVHANTVAEAYRLLTDEGWLDMRRRRGAVVRDRTQPAASPDARASFLRRLRDLTAEAQSAGLPASTVAGTMRSLADRLAAGKPLKV